MNTEVQVGFLGLRLVLAKKQDRKGEVTFR